MFKMIAKYINKFFGIQTPEEYKAYLENRYKNNPELEFVDNCF